MVAPRLTPALTVAALGVVFGDIGTSPLYAFKAALEGGVGTTEQDILGVVSLFIWAIIVIVAIKYIALVTRASHDGEGGIIPLATLAARGARPGGRMAVLIGLAAVVGVGLFFADGAITPAISILGSSAGLATINPSLEWLVVPVALVVIAVLFGIQRFGSGRLGALFGPVMLVWFIAIGALGAWRLVQSPGSLRALDPLVGLAFLVDNPGIALAVLGAVVLCVTGVEVLYADLGHFGRAPIVLGWFAVAMPALLLNYLGQASLLIADPSAASNPFFKMAPDALRVPLVVLATMATFIAAQAVISGVFSMTRQASIMGYLPRARVRHTSGDIEGQVYLPVANVLLLIAVVLFVLIFRTADALAGVYGIAVTGGMVLSTLLVGVVAVRLWGWRLPVMLVVLSPLLAIDLALFTATLTKIPHGGWVAILLTLATLGVVTTWRWGTRRVDRAIGRDSVPLGDVSDLLADRPRVPGVAVVLSSGVDHVSGALMRHLRESVVAHEHVLIVTVIPVMVPRVPDADRVSIGSLGEGVTRITIGDGFFEDPDVPGILGEAWRALGLPGSPATALYIAGDDAVVLDPGHHRALRLRARAFALLHRNEARIEDTFGLPEDRVVRLGAEVRI